MHMPMYMHSAILLLQNLVTHRHRHLHRHRQSIKDRKERDMSTSRKRVYRREGNILIPTGLVQGKNMAEEGSQKDMDIPVPTNAM